VPKGSQPTWPNAKEQSGKDREEPTDGRLALGETIDTLYQELKWLKQFARGRRKTQQPLRRQFPDFQLWEEIDASSSLPAKEREKFFQKTWGSHDRLSMMEFIGKIVAYEEPTVYKIWKEYRHHTGKKRNRRSKAVPTERPKTRSKRKP
jgi:hypothetical protein